MPREDTFPLQMVLGVLLPLITLLSVVVPLAVVAAIVYFLYEIRNDVRRIADATADDGAERRR